MKTLSIKNIIEFRAKSDRGKKSFAININLDKEKVNADGGDYWVSCSSAISSSYKSNDLQPIIDRRAELVEKSKATEYPRTKTMYKRNIAILDKYENFDFKKWRPSKTMIFLKRRKGDSILTIKGFKVLAVPHHVFTFQKDGVEEIGAIWFIAKLDGFKKEDLAMFSDILYRYLAKRLSKDQILNARYCIAVDVYNNSAINYSQLEKDEVPKILNATLDDIKKWMS